MTAKQIFEKLLSESIDIWEITCDKLIAGDPDKEVKKAATCFKLTAEVLDKAISMGVDMIITHEPTFASTDNREDATFCDVKKWEILDKSGITVYRFHDHAHNTEPDYIHRGFIEALGLDISKKHPRESLGITRYELAEPKSPKEIARLISEKLGAQFVRIVGNADEKIGCVCLGLGSVGIKQINYLFDPGCDLFITGEVGEVKVCEMVRDANYYGMKKSIILFGHYSAEYAGMRVLAHELDRRIVPCVYIDSGEVYEGI